MWWYYQVIFFFFEIVQKNTKCNYLLLYNTATFLENVVSVKVHKTPRFYIKHSGFRYEQHTHFSLHKHAVCGTLKRDTSTRSDFARWPLLCHLGFVALCIFSGNPTLHTIPKRPLEASTIREHNIFLSVSTLHQC